MEFHALSRRELQALCKRNKIPANVTNVAMVDSLKALAIVDGIDEVLQACKSEASRAGLEVASPYVPPTGLLTPAQSGVTSRRRRAAKEDSAVKQLYGTRRSARLAEKSAKLLKGVAEFSKKDLFPTGAGLEFKMNLDKSLDSSDELSGVTGIEESVSIDEGHVDLGDRQVVSTDVEQFPAVEEEVSNHSENNGSLSGITGTEHVDSGYKQAVSTDVEQAPVVEEEVSNHSENDGSKSRLEKGVDAKTLVEVDFEGTDETKAEEVKLVPEIEEKHHSTVGESIAAEFEQVGSENEEFGKTKASHDETLALALNLKNEALKADVTEIDFAIAEVSFDTSIHSDVEVHSDADSNSREVVASHENEKNQELNTDSSEAESIPDESYSDILDLSVFSDEDVASNWDVIPEIDVIQSAKQDVATDNSRPTSLAKSPTQHLAAVAPNNVGAAFVENIANPSFIIQSTFSIPKRAPASASKASSRMIRVAAVSDNKENIGSGSKTAPPKERLKMVKEIAEAVPMLDGPSLLSQNFKDLTITQNLDKSEGENGAHANVRIALQALPDNPEAK